MLLALYSGARRSEFMMLGRVAKAKAQVFLPEAWLSSVDPAEGHRLPTARTCDSNNNRGMVG